MNLNDQPAWEPPQAEPAEPAPPMPAESGSPFGVARRTIATVALAIGLLVAGGTAIVFAADPSGSPAPNATTQPSTGTGGSTAPKSHSGNCPNMGGSGGSRGSGGSTAPSTAPSTNGPTSSPAL
jgi:hypothetical protein